MDERLFHILKLHTPKQRKNYTLTASTVTKQKQKSSMREEGRA